MKSFWGRAGAITLLALGLVWLNSEKILFGLGELLVYSEQPIHADAVVVLGGDGSGHRILKGVQLVAGGWAPVAVVSGGVGIYGAQEAYLAYEYAAARGFSREKMVAVAHPSLNTEEEARYDVMEMRRMGVKRYILVTSFSHTGRARRVFRRAAPDLEFTTVGVDEPFWENGRWWTSREGRKIWFFATSKAIADYLGI